MYIFNLLPEIIFDSDEDDTMDVNGIVCEALVSIWSLDQVDSTYIYSAVYVVVQFYPWFKQREIKIKPRIKLNHNIYVVYLFVHTFSCNCKIYKLF